MIILYRIGYIGKILILKNSIGKGQNNLNYEKIIELAPEALITPRNSSYEKDVEQLSKVGIKVIVVTDGIMLMPEQIERLGKNIW